MKRDDGPGLFEPGVVKAATLGGPGDCYRYALSRTWGDGRVVNFLMLNPSVADAWDDDPTIKRCVRYATDWGYSGIVVTNLFALRSTDPDALLCHPDPVGPDNDRHVAAVASAAGLVVCAWGSHAKARARAGTVLSILSTVGASPHALKFTKDGSPCHPLRLLSSLQPIPWKESTLAT